jgi:hypothetical protein
MTGGAVVIDLVDGKWTMRSGVRPELYDCLEIALDDVGAVVFELSRSGSWKARLRSCPPH